MSGSQQHSPSGPIDLRSRPRDQAEGLDDLGNETSIHLTPFDPNLISLRFNPNDHRSRWVSQARKIEHVH